MEAVPRNENCIIDLNILSDQAALANKVRTAIMQFKDTYYSNLDLVNVLCFWGSVTKSLT